MSAKYENHTMTVDEKPKRIDWKDEATLRVHVNGSKSSVKFLHEPDRRRLEDFPTAEGRRKIRQRPRERRHPS